MSVEGSPWRKALVTVGVAAALLQPGEGAPPAPIEAAELADAPEDIPRYHLEVPPLDAETQARIVNATVEFHTSPNPDNDTTFLLVHGGDGEYFGPFDAFVDAGRRGWISQRGARYAENTWAPIGFSQKGLFTPDSTFSNGPFVEMSQEDVPLGLVVNVLGGDAVHAGVFTAVGGDGAALAFSGDMTEGDALPQYGTPVTDGFGRLVGYVAQAGVIEVLEPDRAARLGISEDYIGGTVTVVRAFLPNAPSAN